MQLVFHVNHYQITERSIEIVDMGSSSNGLLEGNAAPRQGQLCGRLPLTSEAVGLSDHSALMAIEDMDFRTSLSVGWRSLATPSVGPPVPAE